MEKVQPIRDVELIQQFKKLLKQKSLRDYMLFVVGINTGLRISDLLKLKAGDVKNKEFIVIREEKTNKPLRFPINEYLKQELENYISSMQLKDDDYLFQSRKGENRPISRIQAYRILNRTAKQLGLDEVGTHTLRKTFGYHHYKRFKDVAMLQEIFNHSSPSITLRYIGITDDEIASTIKDFYL
ncbi:integrase family protein (plasmid) [Caldicellulosiruptor acetigenus I77R1B]|uniref:Integrase family protein n=1 Tax=Caldicellulosiruptor acetigenus (strain ATCC 700853 / DSM 12137 / I77R1B) TaxID=632335 RepID=E4SAY2_CALA7|nr:site-specific integrase [Caldicellulosiruptor acetigenus]ADQ42061.1 integrase family protein [Caldicellulosiruptor acetigenus I77R1B]